MYTVTVSNDQATAVVKFNTALSAWLYARRKANEGMDVTTNYVKKVKLPFGDYVEHEVTTAVTRRVKYTPGAHVGTFKQGKRANRRPTATGKLMQISPEKLRDARVSAGLSQAALASKASVPVVSICRYEKGVNLPRRQSLLRICAALSINPNAVMR